MSFLSEKVFSRMFVGTLVVMGAIFVVGVVGNGCKTGNDWQKAEAEAKAFGFKMAGKAVEATCAHKDTDGDDYCSCTIFSEGRQIPVECGCPPTGLVLNINVAEGCKLDRGMNRVLDFEAH